MSAKPARCLGIVGGLGPLASSEFVKTVYEYNVGDCEQLLPSVVLLSDPGFPDRTETLLSGRSEELLDQLTGTLYKLTSFGVSEVVICCFTMHHLLRDLPGELRQKVISLVDISLGETIRRRRRQLLLCTLGARRLSVFQSHPWWDRAKELIVLPDDRDQETIHHLIYRVKKGESLSSVTRLVESLVTKYGVESIIAGCTELHLISRHSMAAVKPPRKHEWLDPLIVIAENIPNLDSLVRLAAA